MPSSKIVPTPPSPPPTSSVRLPSRRSALIIGTLGVALIVGLLFAATRGDRHPLGQTTAGVEVGHIHGIGIDPGSGRLYIGAHRGTFSVTPDGAVAPVGAVRNDTMAFTVTGPGRFLASGHPELGTDQPVHLGLIESRDAARTWDPVSLSGAADFHALDVGGGGRTWGVDSARQLLLSSNDGLVWGTVTRGQFIDVAADPAGEDIALATTGTGELRSYDPAGKSAGLPDTPPLTFIDWSERDLLVGLHPDGTVLVSTTTASSWETAGQVPGRPSALEVSDDAWYAASDQGLYLSTDDGKSWQALFTYDRSP